MLPMIRNRAIWKRPNPIVSTASSTVNVFDSNKEGQSERNSLCGKGMYVDDSSLIMRRKVLGNQFIIIKISKYVGKLSRSLRVQNFHDHLTFWLCLWGLQAQFPEANDGDRLCLLGLHLLNGPSSPHGFPNGSGRGKKKNI